MNLKKKLLSVAAVIAMTAVALYGSTMEISGVGETDSRFSWMGEKETLYLWYADDELTNYLNGAAVEFGVKENVRVIPILVSDSEYLEALNRASLEGEQVPDVYLLSNDSLEKAYLAGLAAEIQDVENICNEEHFPAAALSAVEYRGKKIAYPLFYETSAFVYNQSYLEQWAEQQALKELASADEEGGSEASAEVDPALLEQKKDEYLAKAVPTTVEEIQNFADTFDVPEAVEGIMKWDVSDIFYNYWIVGEYMIAGGDAGDDSSNMSINNPETVQCLEVYKALNQFFFIESDTVTYDSVIQDFVDGKTVFTIATSDVVNRLESAKADGSFAYEYGIITMPDLNADLKSRSMSVTNAVAVNGYSTRKELANRFAAYLADDYVGNLYERTGKVAANVNANQDNSALQVFMSEYAESVPLPKVMEIGNFWLHLEILFSKVWNGGDVTALLQELANQMEMQIGG